MIQIEIQGHQQIVASLGKLERSWIDFRRIENEAVDLFHDFEREQFSSAPWTELSPNYEKQKARRYPGKPILRRTDSLFRSLTTSGGDAVQRSTATLLEMGAGGESGQVGEWHQLGAGRLPQRKVIDITDRQQDKFVELFEKDMIEFARAEGFHVM